MIDKDEFTESGNQRPAWSSGFVSDLIPRSFDLKQKLRDDGLDYSAIESQLRCLARTQAEFIDELALSFSGREYTLALRIADLNKSFISEAYEAARRLCNVFGEHQPIIYVFGKNQKDSLVFRATDCLNVRNFRDTTNQ